MVANSINKKELNEQTNDMSKSNLVMQINKTYGLDKEFLSSIRQDSLELAKKIVEEYEFDEDMEPEKIKEARKEILYCVLRYAKTYKKIGLLNDVVQNLKKLGFSKNNLYGATINLLIKGVKTGYTASSIFRNSNKILELYPEEIDTEVTNETIEQAKKYRKELIERENKKKILESIPKNSLIQQLLDLGLEEEFILKKSIQNLYTAKKIVDTYEFRHEFTQEELKKIKRVILYAILTEVLNSEEKKLSLVQKRLEKKGLSEQEICGAIINSAINSNMIGRPKFSYSNVVANPSLISQIEKDDINTNVSYITIQKALSEGLNEEETKKLKEDIVNKYGLEEQIVEKIHPRNLYMAKQIVEKYKFSEDLDEEHLKRLKRVILYCLLKNKVLKKEGRTIYTILKKLEEMGFNNKDEIYSIMINFAIDGKIVEKKGYSYTEILMNPNKLLELNPNEIKKQVSNVAIQEVISRNLTEQEKQLVKKQLIEEKGLNEDFVNNRDTQNLYMAMQIVDGYKFNENLSQEELKEIKKVILYSLLKPKKQKGDEMYIAKLCAKLRDFGLSQQEIYGSIINLAICPKVSERDERYNALLRSPYKLKRQKNDLNPVVNMQWVNTAKTKVKNFMKNAIIRVKKQGDLEEIPITMNRLKDLTRNEKISYQNSRGK